jgi:ketosteroid isomerase-like protein
MKLVRELADREAIRDLPIRYCDCISRNDLADVVSLFTDDGSFVVKNPESSVGPKLRA